MNEARLEKHPVKTLWDMTNENIRTNGGDCSKNCKYLNRVIPHASLDMEPSTCKLFVEDLKPSYSFNDKIEVKRCNKCTEIYG